MRALVLLVAVSVAPLSGCSPANASPLHELTQLALAGTPPQYARDTWTIANNLATNVALLGASSGVALDNCKGLMGTAVALSTRTITSGNFRGYAYAPTGGLDAGTFPISSPLPTFSWVPYATLDWAPTAGGQFAVSGDKQVLSGIGRFAWVEDDIVVSGGATIDIIYSVRPAP